MDLQLRTWTGAPRLFRAGRRACAAVLGLGVVLHAAGPAGRPVQRPPPAVARPPPRPGEPWLSTVSRRTPRSRSRPGQPEPCANRLTVSLRGAMLDTNCFGGPTTSRDPALARHTPQFYLTAPSPCPYSAGPARAQGVHASGSATRPAISTTCSPMAAFRRKASRSPTAPPATSAAPCVSVRVIANEFRPSRKLLRKISRAQRRHRRRAAQRDADLGAIFGVPRLSRSSAHRHGGMADMTVLDYAIDGGGQPRPKPASSNTASAASTAASTGRGEGLVAVALSDVLSDGLSMGVFVLRAVRGRAARSAPS